MTMSPSTLLVKLQRTEVRGGRVCERRWGPRTTDLDIVDVGGTASINPKLTPPHPRTGERLFVPEPWVRVRSETTLDGVPIINLTEKLRR